MFHNEGAAVGVGDETLDNFGGDNTLLGVQVGTGFVQQVHFCWFAEAQDQGHALELTTCISTHPSLSKFSCNTNEGRHNKPERVVTG